MKWERWDTGTLTSKENILLRFGGDYPDSCKYWVVNIGSNRDKDCSWSGYVFELPFADDPKNPPLKEAEALAEIYWG